MAADLDQTSAPKAEGDAPAEMKHNDLQLQTLLRLARSCLKYDRLPGEMSERHYFDKFDAERQSQMESAGESAETSFTASIEQQVGPSLELSPPLEAPGEEPPDARTLRRQTSQLERTVSEARQAVEAASAEYRQEVVKWTKLEKDAKAEESDYKRVYRQLRLAKGMVKRQTGEIQQLHDTIAELRAAALAAAQPQPPAPIPQPQPPPAAAKGGRPRPAGRNLKDSGSGTLSPGDSISQQPRAPPPPPPPLAASFVLPPKSRTFESVMTSRPNADAWKLFIP
jgi:hypothetical protein